MVSFKRMVKSELNKAVEAFDKGVEAFDKGVEAFDKGAEVSTIHTYACL